ncbi:MAG: hypothetical protein LBV41_07625 [Cytophagaceae bacterium]|jgi:hypothetical protein|nr:hypothetical protein [Cytophagaceae bacterium]
MANRQQHSCPQGQGDTNVIFSQAMLRFDTLSDQLACGYELKIGGANIQPFQGCFA